MAQHPAAAAPPPVAAPPAPPQRTSTLSRLNLLNLAVMQPLTGNCGSSCGPATLLSPISTTRHVPMTSGKCCLFRRWVSKGYRSTTLATLSTPTRSPLSSVRWMATSWGRRMKHLRDTSSTHGHNTRTKRLTRIERH